MTTTTAAPRQPSNFWLHRFLAGTASGVALVLVGHPMDTIKVLVRVRPVAGESTVTSAPGTLDPDLSTTFPEKLPAA